MPIFPLVDPYSGEAKICCIELIKIRSEKLVFIILIHDFFWCVFLTLFGVFFLVGFDEADLQVGTLKQNINLVGYLFTSIGGAFLISIIIILIMIVKNRFMFFQYILIAFRTIFAGLYFAIGLFSLIEIIQITQDISSPLTVGLSDTMEQKVKDSADLALTISSIISLYSIYNCFLTCLLFKSAIWVKNNCDSNQALERRFSKTIAGSYAPEWLYEKEESRIEEIKQTKDTKKMHAAQQNRRGTFINQKSKKSSDKTRSKSQIIPLAQQLNLAKNNNTNKDEEEWEYEDDTKTNNQHQTDDLGFEDYNKPKSKQANRRASRSLQIIDLQ